MMSSRLCFALLALNLFMPNTEETKISENVWGNSRIEIYDTDIRVIPNFTRTPRADYDLIFECVSDWCQGQKTPAIRLDHTYILGDNIVTFKRWDTILPFTDYVPRIYQNTALERKYPTMKTGPGKPHQVSNLSVYCKSDNELGLKWQPPYPPTGKISTYSITLMEKPINEKIRTCNDFSCVTIPQVQANTEYSIEIQASNEDPQKLGESYFVNISTSDKGSNFLGSLDFQYSSQNSSILFAWENSSGTYCKPERIKIFASTQVLYNAPFEDSSHEISLPIAPHISNILLVAQNFAEEEHSAHARVIKIAEIENEAVEHCFISYICTETCKFKISKLLIPHEDAVLVFINNRTEIPRDYLEYKKSRTTKSTCCVELNMNGRFATAETSETDFTSISVVSDNTLIYPATADKDGLLSYKKVKLGYAVKLGYTAPETETPPKEIIERPLTTRPNDEIKKILKVKPSLTNPFHLIPKIIITIICVIIFSLLVGSILLSRCIYIEYKQRARISEHPSVEVDDDELSYQYPIFEDLDGDSDLSFLNNRNNQVDNPVLVALRESASHTSDESNPDLRNCYTDILDRRSCLERSSETADVSEYYHKLIPENISNVIETKDLEKKLFEWCENDTLETQFKRIENLCKKLVSLDYSTPIESSSNQRSIVKTYKDKFPRYIKGYMEPQAFIHIQYPEPPQINDFWRMIWSKRITNIIAVKNANQRDSEIHKYWPNNEGMFGNILVANCGITNIRGQTTTTFILKYGSKTHIVVHYKISFRGEKDCLEEQISFIKILCGVPEKPTVLICQEDAFLGALLLGNIAMKMALKERKVDFQYLLFSLGMQKISFLSSVNDYILTHFVVYDCLCDERFSIRIDSRFKATIETILTRRSVKPLMDGVTSNFKLYQNIINSQNLNIQRRRFPYIDAIEVDCFAVSRKFICTPQPVINGIKNFWQLVAETKVNTIISLNELNRIKSNHFIFWNDDAVNLTDPVKLKVVEEKHPGPFSKIRVNTISNRNFKEVTILNVREWKRRTFRPSNIQNLLKTWQEIYNDPWTHKDNGVILLTCFNGYTACGLFIAMSILLETIVFGKTCEVYTAVKLVRRFHKQFVQEWGQFDFLHKVALEYSKLLTNSTLSGPSST